MKRLEVVNFAAPAGAKAALKFFKNDIKLGQAARKMGIYNSPAVNTLNTVSNKALSGLGRTIQLIPTRSTKRIGNIMRSAAKRDQFLQNAVAHKEMLHRKGAFRVGGVTTGKDWKILDRLTKLENKMGIEGIRKVK